VLLGAGPHALHGDLSMTAPQSSGTEAIRADIRQCMAVPLFLLDDTFRTIGYGYVDLK
jgi:hypothetical protein